MPFPGISVYAATKSYLRTLSLAIRNELYDRGVRVTAVWSRSRGHRVVQSQRALSATGVAARHHDDARKARSQRAARAVLGRRRTVPGFVNRVFVPLAGLIPGPIVRLIKRKAKFYRYGR